jgi:polysaccharide export outer membrane protein
MQRIIERVALLAIPLVLLAGCATTGSSSASALSFAGATPDQQSQSSELSTGNTIEVSIEVDGNMEVMSHRTQINQQGMVTLPLVGDVEIDGYTLSKARSVIADTYGAYYVNPPVVMISLVIDPEDGGEWGAVTVTGRVGQPGRVPLRSQHGMNLTEVIQLAGGFAPSAKKSDIRISRTDELGMKTRVSVDFDEIGQEGNAEADIKLIAGDVVYVPERIF